MEKNEEGLSPEELKEERLKKNMELYNEVQLLNIKLTKLVEMKPGDFISGTYIV